VGDLYASQGIRANCVAPGPIKSPRLDSIAAANDALKLRTPGQWSATPAAGQARPPGEARDIAEAVLYLASDRARHVNGIVLTVDGGATPTT
jgi:NAD(P)-dependent dehydrogenase (short-subunit alcohol dehydrogenase family)